MSTQRQGATEAERDPDMQGAETAMHRAARRARERAEQVANPAKAPLSTDNSGDPSKPESNRGARPRSAGRSATVSQAPPPVTPPRGTSYGGTAHRTRPPGDDVSRVDDGPHSFSQAQGYEEIPAQLRLEELPREARTQIWNLFFAHISRSTTTGGLDVLDGGPWIAGPWHEILKAKHCDFDHAPLDEWDPESSRIRRSLREDIERRPFNKVFDLIEFVLRHPSCPSGFIRQMRRTFTACRLAYTIDAKRPPTILPAATPEEGDAVVEAIQTLRPAGLDGSVVHLRNASACIKDGDWPGSVRESIHAVESVARQLDPKAPKLLKHALAALEQRGALHPSLKDAFSKLYGYTSNEQGIRHALLDRTDAQVGQDEAVFMLGACASFASYLWRKHVGGQPS